MKRIAVCTFLLLLLPSGARAANPLAPLAKLHAALTRGLSAAMKGTDIEKAFKPLPIRVRPHLVDDIKDAGGVTARVLAMEFELVFYSEETSSYYLRTEVYPAKRGPVLLSFKGRPSEGARAFPFTKYRGYAAPLGSAAAMLAKLVVGKGCARLPVATAADFPFMPPGKLTDRMVHSLKHTSRHLADECEKLATMEKPSRVELRVDDVSFAVLGADGKLVGMIKSQLELDRSGALRLELKRFKRMTPEPPLRGRHHRRPPRDGEDSVGD